MKTNIEFSSLTLLPSCPLFHISFFGTMICSAIPLANLEATCLFSSLLLGSSVLNHVWPFATPWTVAHKAPLSMGFPRQEYWSGLPLPSPGDKHDPGIKLVSPASAGRVLTTVQETQVSSPLSGDYSTALLFLLFPPQSPVHCTPQSAFYLSPLQLLRILIYISNLLIPLLKILQCLSVICGKR